MDGLLLLTGHLLGVGWRHRRWVGACVLLGTATAVASVLIVPPTYRASTLLMPNASQPALSSGLENLSSVAGQLGLAVGASGADPSRIFPDILRSRTLVRRVLQRKVSTLTGDSVQVLQRLHVRASTSDERLERATRLFLERRSDIILDPKNSSIKVVVYDHDPVVAAQVANLMASELDRINQEINRSNARARREFVERRLDEVRAELAGDEETLKDFREQNRMIASSPQLVLESERLARKVHLDEEVYLTLTREHELAKIAEVRDVPVINVLDEAIAPTVPHSPRKRLVVAVVFVFSLAFGLLAAMLWEERRKLVAGFGAGIGAAGS